MTKWHVCHISLLDFVDRMRTFGFRFRYIPQLLS